MCIHEDQIRLNGNSMYLLSVYIEITLRMCFTDYELTVYLSGAHVGAVFTSYIFITYAHKQGKRSEIHEQRLR